MLRLPTRSAVLLAAALCLGGGAFAGCSTLDEWQRQAIFNPARDNPRWFSEPIAGTEEYDLTLENGHRIHMWHIAQPGRPDAPTVLYLHGARWNMHPVSRVTYHVFAETMTKRKKKDADRLLALKNAEALKLPDALVIRVAK